MKRKWRRNEELTTEKSEDDVNWKFQTEIGGLWILLIDLKIEFTTKYQIILHDLIIISTSQFATCFSKFAQILCKYNVDHIPKLVLLSENWVGPKSLELHDLFRLNRNNSCVFKQAPTNPSRKDKRKPRMKQNPKSTTRNSGDSSKTNIKLSLDFTELKEKGNSQFRQCQYKEAEESYTNALFNLGGDEKLEIANVINNLSATFLSLKKMEPAVLCCVVALAIDPNATKPYHRAAIALENLNFIPECCFCAKKALSSTNNKDDKMSDLLKRHSSAQQCSDSDFTKCWVKIWLEQQNSCQEIFSRKFEDLANKSEKKPVELAGELKEAGSFLLKNEKFVEALEKYFDSLNCFAAIASPLLSNRAACRLKCNDIQNGLYDGFASFLIDPNNDKSIYRASQALLELEWFELAKIATSLGLQFSPSPEAFQILEKRIESIMAINLKQEGSNKSTNSHQHLTQFSEKELHEKMNEGKTPTESVAMMNSMFQMVRMMKGKSKKSDPTIDMIMESFDKVPPFHTNFLNKYGFPKGCSPDECYRALWTSYEHYRSIGMHEFSLTSNLVPEESIASPQDVMKRLGSNDPDEVEWYFTAPLKSVRDVRPNTLYQQNIFHSFSNSINRPEIFEPNAVHVAIGFVDLGSIREAIFRNEESNDNLLWVGYESSFYSCAKSLVIAEMLSGGATPDEVLQAWYSSAWSLQTLKAFRDAISRLLLENKQYKGNALEDSCVLELLRYWLTHDVSLNESRKKWIEVPLADSQIPNFKQESDRNALCSWFLTGQLLEAEVGSVAMFAIPPGLGIERTLEENFLYTIDQMPLFAERRKTKDIISAGTNYLLRKISRMAKFISKKKVTIEINCEEISLKTPSALSEIASLNPLSISWSNLCDYFPKEEFHKIARACSGSDTLHFGYSMNWSQRFKGACHLDPQYLQNKELMKVLVEQAKVGMNETIKTLKINDLVQNPFLENARNSIDWLLSQFHARTWCHYFFELFADDIEERVPVMEPHEYRIFARGNTDVFFTYTYSNLKITKRSTQMF